LSPRRSFCVVLRSSRDSGSRNTRRPSKSGAPAAKKERLFKKERSAVLPRRDAPAVQVGAKTNLRSIAAEILMDVLNKGVKLKQSLDFRQKTMSRESDKALLKEIVSGCLRNLPLIDLSIKEFLKREIEETNPFILSLLRVGCYQLLFLDRIPAYAAVNECVDAAKSVASAGAPGFVNTVLRNIANGKESLLSLPYRYEHPLSLSYKYGMPMWLVDRYIGRFGMEEGEALLDSLNKPSQNSILFFSAQDYLSAKPVLEKEGFQLEENLSFPLTFWIKDKNPAESEAFKNGLFYICDPASQLPASILPEPVDGFVVDLCAAPGTKSLILSKKLEKDGFVIASDLSKARITLLLENSGRYGTENIKPLLADVEKGLPFKEKVSSCILDAPCSSMGTIKRSPELRWQAAKERLEKEGRRQLRMLLSASKVISRGGYLLYSVCSIEEEETTEVVSAFLREAPEFKGEKIKIEGPLREKLSFQNDHSVYLFPHKHKGDGFFAALLRRKSGPKNRG
jgi:16S rRNA (cytosine967-C5)-methyltransferase